MVMRYDCCSYDLTAVLILDKNFKGFGIDGAAHFTECVLTDSATLVESGIFHYRDQQQMALSSLYRPISPVIELLKRYSSKL